MCVCVCVCVWVCGCVRACVRVCVCESVKKGKFVPNICFSDNVEQSSEKIWKNDVF